MIDQKHDPIDLAQQIYFHNDFLNLITEHQLLGRDLNLSKEQLDTILADIERFNKQMTEQFGSTLLEIEAATAQLQKLAIEIALEQGRISKEEAEEQKNNKAKAKCRPDDSMADQELIDMCKTLYRKISTLCHPDKTDDTRLHELMVTAQDLRAYHDVEGLAKLLKDAQYMVINKVIQLTPVHVDQEEALKESIANLRAQLMDVKGRLERMLNSGDYELVKMYREDAKSALDLVEANVSMQLGELKIRLAEEEFTLKKLQIIKANPLAAKINLRF